MCIGIISEDTGQLGLALGNHISAIGSQWTTRFKIVLSIPGVSIID